MRAVVASLLMAGPDLNLLIALDALLAEGSVAGASRRLGLSASAMSRTLKRLRAATGDPLLVRAGRGLVPTPRAAELRGRVRDLSAEALGVLRPATVLNIAALERVFTIRANEGFIDAFAARLILAVAAEAPGVRLHFAPKPDKEVRALREGLIDLEIGVLGESGPEVRVQSLFRDRFVAAVREAHPLALRETVTPELYVAFGHVVASRRGRVNGPVDEALAALGLARKVVAVVPGFPAALAIARASDLVALVPERHIASGHAGIRTFPLPVQTEGITISQMWHPRQDADLAHRWLRGKVLAICHDRAELCSNSINQRKAVPS
jgi:DNA-binding transcriptional LysR family regulator